MRSYKEQTEKILKLVEQKKKVREKRNNILVTCSLLAACVAIALFSTSLFSDLNQMPTLSVNDQTVTSNKTSVSYKTTDKTKTSKKNTGKPTTTVQTKTTKKAAKSTTGKPDEIIIVPDKSNENKPSAPDKYFSYKNLDENSNDVIIYKGKSYIKTCSLEESDNSRTKLLNVFLGKTTGKIDNKATEDVTSNVNGKVYTVNGYSESFRLGMVTKDKSTEKRYIYIFDDINSLKTSVVSSGSELFNDILHIDKNLSFINFYSGTNLDIALFNQSNILTIISEKNQKLFLDSLNNASLISGDESVFDNNDKKVVLFLNMSDETTVEIYLTKNGYIFCDGLYFKTDSNVYTEVYYSLTE